mgnify:CR=1 FL=1
MRRSPWRCTPYEAEAGRTGRKPGLVRPENTEKNRPQSEDGGPSAFDSGSSSGRRLRRRERLLYLGTAQPPEGGWAEYLGRAYDVQTARPIYVGERLSHWWAMLEPRDEEGEA